MAIEGKERRRLLGLLDRKDTNLLEWGVFVRLKQEGFDFLMELLETQGANPRQLRNALSIVFRMRREDDARFVRSLHSLRDTEDIPVRSWAWHLLVPPPIVKKPVDDDLLLLKRREDAVLDAIQARSKGREPQERCPFCEGRLEVRATPLERPFTRYDVVCPCGRCTCALRGMAPGVYGGGR